jgi:hypothetical protein
MNTASKISDFPFNPCVSLLDDQQPKENQEILLMEAKSLLCFFVSLPLI